MQRISFLALTLALAACSSSSESSGDPPPASSTEDGGGTPDAEPTGDASPDADAGTGDAAAEAAPDAAPDADAAPDGDAAAEADAPTFPSVTGITVSTGELVPAFSPDVLVYDVTALGNLEPVSIVVTGQDVTIDGTAVADGATYTTTPAVLDDAHVIAIEAKDAQGNAVTYEIRTAPPDRPKYDLQVVASPKPGLIYLAADPMLPFDLNKPNYLYILDELGTLRYFRKVPRLAFDFKRQILTTGETRYTYIVLDTPQFQKSSLNEATVNVLDEHFQPLTTARILPFASHADYGVDEHEFILLEDDHWILEGYLPETVNDVPGRGGPVDVVAGVIQEVKAGQVILEWDSTSVPELYADTTENLGGTGHIDYVHLNSVEIDPTNQNLVVSLRHTDEVLELDRMTGQVLWTLGGKGDDFGLADADKASHQHFARFTGDDTLLMFDNGNASGLSKVREYQLDRAGMAGQLVTDFSVDAHYSSAMGSVQKIDGNFFIGWGYRKATESDVTEVDPNGVKTFELTFRDGYLSYRAHKLP